MWQFLYWILFSFELLSHSKSFYINLYTKNWILKFVTFSIFIFLSYYIIKCILCIYVLYLVSFNVLVLSNKNEFYFISDISSAWKRLLISVDHIRMSKRMNGKYSKYNTKIPSIEYWISISFYMFLRFIFNRFIFVLLAWIFLCI